MDMKSPTIKKMFRRRWLKGLPAADIARELDVERRTLWRWAKEMGLPLRRPFGHKPKVADYMSFSSIVTQAEIDALLKEPK